MGEQVNITEFLEARIAEDEAGAINRVVLRAEDRRSLTMDEAERVHAECAAKRVIVELHGPLEDRGGQSGVDHGFLWCGSCGTLDDAPVPFPCETLEALAAVYKDHPDYRQEWAK